MTTGRARLPAEPGASRADPAAGLDPFNAATAARALCVGYAVTADLAATRERTQDAYAWALAGTPEGAPHG